MAKTRTKSSNNGFMTGAAEVIGGALGTIAGKITRLRADHPHPVQEVKEALAAGRRTGSKKTPKKAKTASRKTVKRGKKVPRRASKTATRRG